MRLRHKTGVPVVLESCDEAFIGLLNAKFSNENTRTEVDNKKWRQLQNRFLGNRQLTFREWFAKKLLNSLSEFLGEHQKPRFGSRLSYVCRVLCSSFRKWNGFH